MRTALLESHADEQKEHEAAIGRLQGEYDRLRHRLYAMYVDKLEGRIGSSFYSQMSEQWRTEQDKIAREIARHQAADRSYLEEGVQLIELTHGAQRLFAKQEAQEQRRLLNFVLSNSIWKDGELTATFRQPFNLIAEATAAASGGEGGGGLNSPGHPVWLGEDRLEHSRGYSRDRRRARLRSARPLSAERPQSGSLECDLPGAWHHLRQQT